MVNISEQQQCVDKQQCVDQLLQQLEHSLKALNLWSDTSPSVTALASCQPFCIDTLTFPQWLQFVLLVRIRALLVAGLPLPVVSGIAPMAEEYVKPLGGDTNALVTLLQQLDAQLQR